MSTAESDTGLRITYINNRGTGAKSTKDEWILIQNDGSQSWDLCGWLITDETQTQAEPHIYRLPHQLGDGQSWHFAPGESLYLITGWGTDDFVGEPSGNGRPQFHFYWNRDAFVWNNHGDRVYLRQPDGTFATQPFPIP